MNSMTISNIPKELLDSVTETVNTDRIDIAKKVQSHSGDPYPKYRMTKETAEKILKEKE